MSQPSKPRVSLTTRLLDKTVLPGMLGFTKLGYKLQNNRADPLPDHLVDRRMVITGATSGLGLAAAHALAALGADLVLVGRSERKLETVAEAIVHEHHLDEPRIERADLSLMSDVRDLADRLLRETLPIHVLINNAGALFTDRAETPEGHERSLALNLMSPFLLTNLLIPRLVRSHPARVINVSSGGMYTQRIQVEDLGYENESYDGAKAYARAKRGQVILTDHWARELADKQVVVHAMHPGWADTPGVRTSLPGFHRLTKRVLRTPEEGADTIVWLAAAQSPANSTAGFWLDRQARLAHVLPGTRASEEEERALWAALEKLTGSESSVS